MSSSAVGKIVIDAEMQTAGIFAGTKEMDNAIKSLKVSLGALNKDMAKSLTGYADAMRRNAMASDNYYTALQNMRDKAQQLEDTLAGTNKETEQYKLVLNVINRLIRERNQLINSGVSQESNQFKSKQAEIEQYEKIRDEMIKSGDAYTGGAEAVAQQAMLDSLREQIAAMEAAASEAPEYQDALIDAFENVKEHLRELIIARNDLSAQKDDLQGDIELYDRYIQKSTDDLAELNQQKADLESKGAALESEIESYDEKIQQATDDIANMADKKEDLEAEKETLPASVSEYDEMINLTTADLEQMQQAKANVENEKAEVDSQLDDYTQKVQQASDSIEQLHNEKKQMAESGNVSTEEIEAYDEKIDQAVRSFNDLVIEKSKLTADSNALAAEIEEYDNNIKYTSSDLQQLNAEKTQLENRPAEIDAELQTYDEKIQQATADLEQLQTAKVELESQAAWNGADIEAVDAKITDATADLARMTEAKTEMESSSAAIDSSIEQYNEQIRSATEEFEHLNAEREKFVTDVDPLELEVEYHNSGEETVISPDVQTGLENAQTNLSNVTSESIRAAEELGKMASAGDGVKNMAASVERAGFSFKSLGQAAGSALGFLRNVGSVGLSAIRGIASTALQAARGLANMAMQGVRGLANIASRAAHAAAALAKMAGSAALSFMKKLASSAKNAAVSLARMVGNAVSSGLKRIGSLAASAAKSLLGMGKSAKKSSGGLDISFKKLLRYGFGIRSTFVLFNRIRKAMQESFGYMAQVDAPTNKAISSITTALTQLKNSFASAFQPIVTAVGPYIAQFITMLSGAATKVAEFVALLTGQDYVLQATATQEDYAKSLDKTAKSSKKATKEAKNQLAAFDHLNILSDNNSGDTGTGSSTDTDPSKMFKKIPVASLITDFMKDIKEAIEKGDFFSVATIIAGKLNEALEKIKSFISWDNVGDVISGYIDKIAGFVNGLVDPNKGINFTLIGETIGEGINTILRAFNELFDGIKWQDIGYAIASGLNGLFKKMNWEYMGELLGRRMDAITDVFYEIFDNVNWFAVGVDVARGLIEVKNTVHWDKVGEMFGKAFNGALDVLRGFAKTFEWGDAGVKFGEMVEKIDETVEWTKIGETLNSLMKGALFMIKSALLTFNFGASIGTRFAKTLNGFFEDKTMFAEAGETFNTAMLQLLELGDSFFEKFKEGEAARAIKAALGKIRWEEIATNAWGLAKKAFAEAGSFVDVLFTDESKIHYDPWKQMYVDDNFEANSKSLGTRIGNKLAEVVNKAIKLMPLNDITDMFSTTLVGALKLGKAFVEDFKADEAGTKIADALKRIPWKTIADDTWAIIKGLFSKAGSFLDALFAGESVQRYDPWTQMYITEPDTESIGKKIGKKLSDVVNKGIDWIPLDEITSGFNDVMIDAIELGEAFVTGFDAKGAGEKIRDAIDKIKWGEIADGAWRTIKTAFSKGFDFADALFSEKLDVTRAEIDPAYAEKIANFNSKSLGGKIGARIGEAISKIPWGELTGTLSEGAAALFKNFSDAFKSLGEKDENGKNKITKAIEDFLGGIKWKEVAQSLIEAAWNLFILIGETLGQLIWDGLKAVFYKSSKKTFDETAKALEEGASIETVMAAWGESSAAGYFSAFMSYVTGESGWVASEFKNAFMTILQIDEDELKTISAEDVIFFYNGFADAVKDENGQVKEEFRTQMVAIMGEANVEAFEAGKLPVDTFFKAFLEAVNGNDPEARAIFVELMNGIGEATKESAAANASETVDAYTEEYAEATQEAQPDLEKTLSDMLAEMYENVNTGDDEGSKVAEAYFEAFKKIVMLAPKHVNPLFTDVVTSIFGSVDALEKGNVTATDFMNGLKNGANDESASTQGKMQGIIEHILEAIRTETFEEHSPSKRSAKWGENLMKGLVNGVEDEKSSTGKDVSEAFAEATDIKFVMAALDESISSGMEQINSTFTKGIEDISAKSASTWTEIKKQTTDDLLKIKGQVHLVVKNINEFVEQKIGATKSDVSNGMSDMYDTISTDVDAMSNKVTNGFVWIYSEIVGRVYSALSDVNNMDWYSIGVNIVNGIGNGLSNRWQWLGNMVTRLAQQMLQAAKNALGIHSPSRIFRDEVGEMVGMGIAEGIDDSEIAILSNLSGLGSAMANKMNAISDSVEFRTPVMAMGNVMPYSIEAAFSADSQSDALVGALTASNDDLSSVIIQAVTNATSAIVGAIQQYGGGGSMGALNVDAIIDEINRRTKAQGHSPLMI